MFLLAASRFSLPSFLCLFLYLSPFSRYSNLTDGGGGPPALLGQGKQEQTLFNDLRQGIAIRKKLDGFKLTEAPSLFILKGGKRCKPLKFFGQRGQRVTPCNDIIWWTQTTWTNHLNKQRKLHLPPWFQNRVWPPPTGWKNTGWFISHHNFGMWPPPPFADSKSLFPNPQQQQQQEEEKVKRRPLFELWATAAGKNGNNGANNNGLELGLGLSPFSFFPHEIANKKNTKVATKVFCAKNVKMSKCQKCLKDPIV